MAVRTMTEKERIRQAWKRWHSSNTSCEFLTDDNHDWTARDYGP